jgi:nitroreductase
MDLTTAIRDRRSIRVFDGASVDRAIIDELIDAATYAPSRQNTQPWHFHIAMGHARRRVGEVMALTTSYLAEYIDVLGPENLERAARFYADLGGAPVVIGVSCVSTEDEHEARDYALSVGAAVQNVLLLANDRGLGACAISVPHWIRDRLAQVFEIPEGREIMCLILLGHADETPGPRERRTDVATYLT